MNKYDKEDTVGAGTFILVCLLGCILALFALVGFICFSTWLFNILN